MTSQEPQIAPNGFHVKGSLLLDAKGNAFIIRGVNHGHAWYVSQLQTVIPAIAATGANTVRVVLSTGDRWRGTSANEVAEIIRLLKKHQLIGVLEVHDCTGFSEQSGSVPQTEAIAYWLRNDIKAVIEGQEAYVIINIANEPSGNDCTANQYIVDTKAAIQKLRGGGIAHTLMVDGANWGQDWANTMCDSAKYLLSTDPQGNILFSVHMYEEYGSEEKVNTYLRKFVSNQLAVIVGEFAMDQGMGKSVAAAAILKVTVQNGQGYLGWSWKGNSPGLESLDIARTWDGSELSTWGKLLIHDENGIKAQAKTASVFEAVNP